MSLCIRTISSKLPKTVGTRKPVSHLERRFQSVQTKINKPSTLKDASKSIPLAVTYHQHRYFDDRLSLLKLTDLRDSRFAQRYQTKTRSSPGFERSFHQRNGSRILDHYTNVDALLFSTKSNPGLKEFDSNSSIEDRSSTKSKGTNPSREGRPSVEQIEKIKLNLSYNLPRFFVQGMDYHIYSHDLVFVNNFRGTTTNGFTWYYLQTVGFKMFAHFRFIFVKFRIIKITSNPEDDSVKVRWRITGISGMNIFSRFLSFKNPFRVKDAIQREQESWLDGFSTFYINSDGKIYKHVADKIMPDMDMVEEKNSMKIPVKLALCCGISNLDFFFSDVLTKV